MIEGIIITKVKLNSGSKMRSLGLIVAKYLKDNLILIYSLI